MVFLLAECIPAPIRNLAVRAIGYRLVFDFIAVIPRDRGFLAQWRLGARSWLSLHGAEGEPTSPAIDPKMDFTADFDGNGRRDLLFLQYSMSDGRCIDELSITTFFFDQEGRPAPWQEPCPPDAADALHVSRPRFALVISALNSERPQSLVNPLAKPRSATCLGSSAWRQSMWPIWSTSTMGKGCCA